MLKLGSGRELAFGAASSSLTSSDFLSVEKSGAGSSLTAGLSRYKERWYLSLLVGVPLSDSAVE